MKPKSRLTRKLLWIAGAGALALLIWCGTLYFHITGFEGVPKTGAELHADVGIVLGATLWDDKPSPALKERLDYALQLYEEGVYSRFIVTGGLDFKHSKLSEAEGMRDYLVSRGVPAERIALDKLSRSTYENLLFSRRIMEDNGWKSAVVVTHTYHGARAADIAGFLGYSPVQVRVTDSKVLMMSYHETREVLAYTKWLLQKWF